MKLVALGLCIGAGIQAWRNFPADGSATIGPAVLVMVIGCICAFLGGLALGRGTRGPAGAVAVATASAEAVSASHSTVNLAVVVPGQGAGTAPLGVQVPSDAAAWLDGPRPMLEVGDLDGMDLSEFAQETEAETA